MIGARGLAAGGIRLQSNILMAPMVSYTPYPFRLLCQELGAGLAFTEMVSSNALKYRDEANRRLLLTTPAERVKAAQLLGNNPDLMERAACGPMLEPFDIIDINMGCPVPNVIKSGEGCALMTDPKRAAKMIAGCRRSGKVVSVKFRTGMRRDALCTAEFARMCEAAGADLLTIHGRSRDMMYEGEPFYSEIRDAKAAVRVPVVANGGIDSLQKARQVLEWTGADGIMVARHALENPWIFSAFTGRPATMGRHAFIARLMELTQQHYDENFTLGYIKKMASYLMRKLPGTKRLKLHLHASGDLAELAAVLEEIFGGRDDSLA